MSAAPLGRRFLTIWVGQAVSAVGSTVSGIGVAVFVFVETGDASTLGWFVAIASLPFVLTGPLMPLTDRWARRAVMIAGDSVAVVGPAIALGLALAGRLEVWHLAVAAFVGGIGTSFQVPAASASIPALVPDDAIDRANGLDQVGQAAGIVIGPIIATPLVARWGIEAVLIVDVVTFLVALGTTVAVPFDDVAADDEVIDDGSWRSARAWLWGTGRPLLAVLAVMAATNFALSLFNVSILVVATAAGGVALAGVALGVGGLAMLMGSIWASRRGVRDDRLGAVSIGLTVLGVGIVIAATRPVFALVVVGVAVALSPVPAIGAAASTVFHERVPPSMYGRVFGLRAILGRALEPLGAVVGGYLVADLAEPAMRPGGSLDGTLGRLVGVGEGRGAALVLASAGVVLVLAATMLRRSGARRALHATAPHLSERHDPLWSKGHGRTADRVG